MTECVRARQIALNPGSQMTKCDRLHGMKIRVLGTSGSGKSRLAAQISQRYGIPRLELDAVFWDAEWTHRDVDEARAMVREFVASHPDSWVMDGNWTSRLEGLLDPGSPDGADLVVWLDHPRPVVMRRVIRRTLRRGIRREVLWHGNRERPSSWLKRDPEENIIRWSWVQHPVMRERMEQRMNDGWPVVRLRDQRAVDAWLASLADEP